MRSPVPRLSLVRSVLASLLAAGILTACKSAPVGEVDIGEERAAEQAAACEKNAPLLGAQVPELSRAKGTWTLVEISCPKGYLSDKGRDWNRKLQDEPGIRSLRILRGDELEERFRVGKRTLKFRLRATRLDNGFYRSEQTKAPAKDAPPARYCDEFGTGGSALLRDSYARHKEPGEDDLCGALPVRYRYKRR